MANENKKTLDIKEERMSMRFFISYTTKNQWLVPGLQKLIETARPDAQVFCSATGGIDPGENYRKAIFENLHQADTFIAIVSNEYWKSKYCIVELGAAYQRYCYDSEKTIDIQPLLLPPLEKSMAMANTPLTELQVTDLTNTEEMTALLRRIAGSENEANIDKMNIQIAEFVGFLKKTILTNKSLTDDADANAYYDEPPANAIDKDTVVKVWRSTKDSNSFQFMFNLSQLSYTPSFISMALEYDEEVNFRDYLKIDPSAAFSFRVNNVDDILNSDDDGILESISVEFKIGDYHTVYKRFELELKPGENQLSIPLADMNHRPLGEINQICFVIYPKNMKKTEGIIVIDDIHVAFDRELSGKFF